MVYNIKQPKTKITGRMSSKRYRCDRCGFVSKQSTNHYGKIYNMRCEDCSWKNGTQPLVTMSCIEKLPKGYKKPEEWKSVTIGEITNPKFKSYMKEYLSKS